MTALNRYLSAAGQILSGLAGWTADRLEDFAGWLAGVIRYLPARIARLVRTAWSTLVAIASFAPSGLAVWRRGGAANFRAWLRSRFRHGAARVIQVILEALDIVGVPELFALIWRALTRATPLTAAEISAAATVLGPSALRYRDVRVAQGGILELVFKRNGARAFCTFHTVNLPRGGGHARENLDIVLHELVHVLQYERAGSRYFAEALLAQRSEGYGYGGPAGLRDAWSKGRRLRDFNREQQAQIIQDYYMHVRHGLDTSDFAPYVAELREGKL